MDRRRVIGLALVQIFGLYVLTRVFMLERFPYLGDEGWHGGFAVRASHGHLWASYDIAKEPFFIWLAAVWIKLGVPALDAVRLVSFFSGLVTMTMIGLLARRLAGDAAGLAAMAVYAALPLFLMYDINGIMDPLVTALAAVALYLQLRLAERPDLRLGLALGVVFLVGVLSKESAKALIALMPLSLACFDWSARARRERLLRWVGAAAIAGGGAVLAIVILHSPAEWDKVPILRRNFVNYPVRPARQALEDPFHWASLSWPTYRTLLLGYVTIPVMVAGLAGFGLALTRRARLALVMAAWIVFPFCAALIFPLQIYPRHLLLAMPPAIAFVGVALAWAASRAYARLGGGRLAAVVVTCGLLLVMLPALRLDARVLADPAHTHYPGVDDAQFVTGISAGSIWPDVAGELRRRSGGRRVVVLRYAALTEVLDLMLDNRFRFVDSDEPDAGRARFIVRDVGPFADPRAESLIRRARFRIVRRFQRPRGGATVILYERPEGP
jgi:hypothetical protein